MTISLYDATVPSWLQILGSVRNLVDKAEAFCAAGNISEAELLNVSLADDMLPLSAQLKWVSTHSSGALQGVREGLCTPDRAPVRESFADFRSDLDASIAALKQVTPEEIESFIGRDVRFSVPNTPIQMDFTAENFLLSFSLPNFYFHAATAYDILRSKGLSIGKRDFLGAVRIKLPA